MRKWLKWFVHNSIVHPIMPFIPKKAAIKLHDKNAIWAFEQEKNLVINGGDAEELVGRQNYKFRG